MLEEWQHPGQIGESQVQSLLRRIEQAIRDSHLAHRCAQQGADITRETLELELAQQRARTVSMEEELARVCAELAAALAARVVDTALLEASLSSTRVELD